MLVNDIMESPVNPSSTSTPAETSPGKSDSNHDKKSSPSTEEPKPRIVLTFRSEKAGLKSTTMKIVPNDEKCEKLGQETNEDGSNESSTKKTRGATSESDESLSDATSKRSVRSRTKENTDSVLANAIARKEKSFTEPTQSTQRPSRRIKPTAKVLANKELKLEAQKTEEPSRVQTRRSQLNKPEPLEEIKISPKKKKLNQEPEPNTKVVDIKQDNKCKKKHLGHLGLKAVSKADNNEESSLGTEEDDNGEERDVKAEDYLEDNNSLEEMFMEGTEEEEEEEDSDEDFSFDSEVKSSAKRTTRRRQSRPAAKKAEVQNVEDSKDAPRRSTRLRRGTYHGSMSPYTSEHSDEEDVDNADPPQGDEGAEAICPEDDNTMVGTCHCEKPTNVYAVAEPDDKDELFCRAIESVDEVRVGCSHVVPRGEHTLLHRAGPRTPFVSLCALHVAQLRKHMCCTTCGLFCTQGIFYQCSLGHLFHLECGLPSTKKPLTGCPHCGHTSRFWEPLNKECSIVRLTMQCGNKRIYMPEQRTQCAPAYLSFSSNPAPLLDKGPLIPEELVPTIKINVKDIMTDKQSVPIDQIAKSIVEHSDVNRLVDVMAGVDVKATLESVAGGTLVHLAAKCGNLSALYLLNYAGANLNQLDSNMKTPLIVAVMTLLDKKDSTKTETPMEVDTENIDSEDTVNQSIKPDGLIGVIRYLIAAGCDVNAQGPEGMTALHIACQYGSMEVSQLILSSADAEVDAKDHGGWTPLVWAAENKYPDVVRLLLSQSASTGVLDSEGNSAIHWCSATGDERCLQLLLHNDNHINACNHNGDTALHIAARQGHFSCVVVLLARGARTDIKNADEALPVDVCTDEKCQAVINVNMKIAQLIDNPNKGKILSSDISRGRDRFPVPCYNDIDDEPLPEFKYVTKYVTEKPLSIDNTLSTMQGCSCVDSCVSGMCACVSLSVKRWWVRGRLINNFPYHDPPMLFQCNLTCNCDLNRCTNMIVPDESHSMFVPVSVVRRSPPLGWSLRSERAIPKGVLVGLYTGEMLKAEDADARTDDQYMFALELKAELVQECSDKKQMCIDARRLGNACRFINHSCHGNVSPVRLFVEHRDLSAPTVAFFANTNIQQHEDITFDYGDKFWSVKRKFMVCACGTPECRYSTKD